MKACFWCMLSYLLISLFFIVSNIIFAAVIPDRLQLLWCYFTCLFWIKSSATMCRISTPKLLFTYIYPLTLSKEQSFLRLKYWNLWLVFVIFSTWNHRFKYAFPRKWYHCTLMTNLWILNIFQLKNNEICVGV